MNFLFSKTDGWNDCLDGSDETIDLCKGVFLNVNSFLELYNSILVWNFRSSMWSKYIPLSQ